MFVRGAQKLCKRLATTTPARSEATKRLFQEIGLFGREVKKYRLQVELLAAGFRLRGLQGRKLPLQRCGSKGKCRRGEPAAQTADDPADLPSTPVRIGPATEPVQRGGEHIRLTVPHRPYLAPCIGGAETAKDFRTVLTIEDFVLVPAA